MDLEGTVLDSIKAQFFLYDYHMFATYLQDLVMIFCCSHLDKQSEICPVSIDESILLANQMAVFCVLS